MWFHFALMIRKSRITAETLVKPCLPVSSEISEIAPCAHEQSNIAHTKYAKKSDDWVLEIQV